MNFYLKTDPTPYQLTINRNCFSTLISIIHSAFHRPVNDFYVKYTCCKLRVCELVSIAKSAAE